MRLRFIQLCGILVLVVPFLGLPGSWKEPLLWFLGAVIVVLGHYEITTSEKPTIPAAPVVPPPAAPAPIVSSAPSRLSVPTDSVLSRPPSPPRARRVTSVRTKSSVRNEAPKIQ